MKTISRQELLALPPFISVETAASILGIGRTRAYELAKHDQFPCRIVRVGTTYHVVTEDIRRLAGIEDSTPAPHPG